MIFLNMNRNYESRVEALIVRFQVFDFQMQSFVPLFGVAIIFSTTVSGSKFGAVDKRRWPLVGGEESKIGQNCQRIVLKNCRYWGEGVKNC